MALDVAHGDFETSHLAECPDVAPECATTVIPPHEHHVGLGLTHTELSAEYGIREQMQLSLRLPYDVKAMSVRYTTLAGAPYTPPYGDIHHRTETLTGLSDASLQLDVARGDAWIFGFGTTLPIGHIVPDPIVLGREGKTHEHIQFGSGTFEPRLAAQWLRDGGVRLFARAEARVSLYENREGYRAPSTLIWSAGPSFRAGALTIDPRLDGQLQTLGRWSGVVDEGTGFRNGGARLQISMPYRGVTFAPSVYHELWSHGSAGQTFRQRTTWAVAISRLF